MRVNSAAISRVSARGQFFARDLDADDLAVMAHPELTEAERAQRVFSLLDRARALRG